MKKIKQKKCKICKSLFDPKQLPGSTLTNSWCSVECAFELASQTKAKLIEKKRLADKKKLTVGPFYISTDDFS